MSKTWGSPLGLSGLTLGFKVKLEDALLEPEPQGLTEAHPGPMSHQQLLPGWCQRHFSLIYLPFLSPSFISWSLSRWIGN